ncbi:612_t:CDS:2, partial [Ambispora leptoticha]
KGARVIDIGCGTGTWILDMARQYPRSYFIGVDISPIFPSEGLPVNVNFIECNLLDGLPFEDSYFDFIHQKFLVAAFTQSQWKEKVIPEFLRLTRPVQNFMLSKGLNNKIGEVLPSILESTNAFSEIKNQKKSITLGKRGGKNGVETLKFTVRGLSSARGWLSTLVNLTPEHFDALLETFSLEAEKFDTFVYQYRICGRKN